MRLPVNITALVSTTVFKLIQKDCKEEPPKLKCGRGRSQPAQAGCLTRTHPTRPAPGAARRLTFFGEGEAGWYYGLGSQSFQVEVETSLGCGDVQMEEDGGGDEPAPAPDAGSGSGNGTASGEEG